MTISQKRQIIAKSRACPSMTHADLADWAAEAFQLPRKPARPTISAILSNATRILSKSYGDGKRRKPLKVASERMERRLALWIQEYEDQNVYLSRQLIKTMARDLQVELCDAWDLGLSDGWLTRFLLRHGLKSRRLHGEAASASPKVVHEGLQSLQKVTDLYSPSDVYNMDETGLCYAMAPARSICSKNMRGVKKNKTRITLALTSNADGSDTLPILFLGRAAKPRCFSGKTPAECGFHYKNNSKAWMTGAVYRDWLRALDRDMRAAGRHILLLLDNASSHSSGGLALTNVRVHKLPPNTTAYLQPMDAGIIATFKQHYRRKQLEWVFGKIKRREKIDKNAYKIDQRQAMEWSEAIWEDMRKTQTMHNCFRHTGVIFNGVDERSSCSYGDDVKVDEVILRTSQFHL